MSVGICPTYCVCTTTPPTTMVCTGGPAPVSQWPVAHSVPALDVFALVLLVVLLVTITAILNKARK